MSMATRRSLGIVSPAMMRSMTPMVKKALAATSALLTASTPMTTATPFASGNADLKPATSTGGRPASSIDDAGGEYGLTAPVGGTPGGPPLLMIGREYR